MTPRKVVSSILDRHERLMGFGHRVYRAEDPRARVLRRTCKELGAPRFEAAQALEQAALTELRERRPDRPIETNVEFWAAVILDFAEVPPHMMPAMFTLRPHRRLVGAHHGAEEDRPAGPPVGALRRPGAAQAGRCRGLGGHSTYGLTRRARGCASNLPPCRQPRPASGLSRAVAAPIGRR